MNNRFPSLVSNSILKEHIVLISFFRHLFRAGSVYQKKKTAKYVLDTEHLFCNTKTVKKGASQEKQCSGYIVVLRVRSF